MIEHAQERVHLDDVSDVHEDVMIEHAHEQVRLDDVRDVHDKVSSRMPMNRSVSMTSEL